MLAPRTSSAFVCIRCQFRLARTRLPSVTRQPSHATFSASASRRDEVEDDAQLERPKTHTIVNPRPLGKLRRRRGKSVREVTAPLGVKTLGKDAEIIVLKEVGNDTPEEIPKPRKPSEKDNELSHSKEQNSILASLQEEGKPIGQEEINKQLESLRPESNAGPDEPNYISQAEFLKLNKLLYDGFTVQQLSRYFSVAMGIQKHLVKEEVLQGLKKGTGQGKNPTERTEWHPGTTPISRRLPGVNMAKGPKKRPVSKNLLVDQILRNAWNVMLLEEIEASGEIELSLKRWQLSLLNAGATPTRLDQIGSIRKAKIEVYWPHNVLRITADKSSAEYAASDIENSLQNTQRKRFGLQLWRPFLMEDKVAKDKLNSVLSQNALQTVEKLTGAVLEKIADDAFLIRGFHNEQILEAQRYLTTILPLKPTFSRVVHGQGWAAQTGKAYLHPITFTSSLDYYNRGLNFSRWSFPASRSTERQQEAVTTAREENEANAAKSSKVAPPISTLQKRALGVLQDPLLHLPKGIGFQETRPEGQAFWSTDVQTRISAEFGQVVIPMNLRNRSTAALHSKSVAQIPPDAPFSSSIPGLSKLLADIPRFRKHQMGKQTLEYTFTPSPYSHIKLDPSEVYPALAIPIQMSDDGGISLRGVRLRFNEHFCDTLLPHQATDIRFKKSQQVWLHNALSDSNIREFYDAIHANIESGGRLTAPPVLKMRIPQWTIRGKRSEGKAKLAYELRPIEYLFTGIKHRQIIRMAFKKHELAYTAVQAGKLGGKGGKLELYNKSDDETLLGTEELEKFVKNSFEVSELITEASMNTKSLQKLLKPRSQSSARKVARQQAAQQQEPFVTTTESEGQDNPIVTVDESGNSIGDTCSNDVAEYPKDCEMVTSRIVCMDPETSVRDASAGEGGQGMDTVIPSLSPIDAGDISDPHIASFLAENIPSQGDETPVTITDEDAAPKGFPKGEDGGALESSA